MNLTMHSASHFSVLVENYSTKTRYTINIERNPHGDYEVVLIDNHDDEERCGPYYYATLEASFEAAQALYDKYK